MKMSYPDPGEGEGAPPPSSRDGRMVRTGKNETPTLHSPGIQETPKRKHSHHTGGLHANDV